MKISLSLFRVFVCTILIGIIFSCNRKGNPPQEPGPNDKDSANEKPLYMKQLRLSAKQYKSLKAFNGNVLVFQFFYPVSKSYQSPTLYGYALLKEGKSYGKTPVELSYDSVTTEPFTGRAQVLGDQQLKIADMDNLVKQLSEVYKGEDYYFQFTPRFYSDNPHANYEVQAKGGGKTSSGSLMTNPSPPAHSY